MNVLAGIVSIKYLSSKFSSPSCHPRSFVMSITASEFRYLMFIYAIYFKICIIVFGATHFDPEPNLACDHHFRPWPDCSHNHEAGHMSLV